MLESGFRFDVKLTTTTTQQKCGQPHVLFGGGGWGLVYRRSEAKHGHSGDAHKALICASFVTGTLTAISWKPLIRPPGNEKLKCGS